MHLAARAVVAMFGLVLALMIAATYPPPSTQGLFPANGYSWLCEDAPKGCGHVPKSLRRPLHLPKLAPGTRCPVSVRHPLDGPYAPGLGAGPVYPVGFSETSTLDVAGPPGFKLPWRGQKVLWTVDPTYRGPELIRGHQLDGKWWVGFEVLPMQELQLPPLRQGEDARWRGFPSYTRVRGAGCYAYQVDGASFSRVLVFRTRLGS